MVQKRKCPGSKIRSKGKGRGLGIGKGKGPIGGRNQRVRSYNRRSTKGKTVRVRAHTRAGKARAVARIQQTHPGLKQSEISNIFDMSMSSIQDDIKKEGRVNIPQLGTFKVKRTKAKKARMGMNPFTRQKQMLKAKPAGKKVKFYPGKLLKNKI